MPSCDALAAGPELGHRRADRRHDAHTRHDDAVRYAGPLHLDVVPVLWRLGRMAILAGAGQALAAAAPEPAMRARTRSTTEPTVLKSDASSLAL